MGTLQETEYTVDHLIFLIRYHSSNFCGNDPLDDIMFKSGMQNSEKGIFYFSWENFLRIILIFMVLVTKLKV